MDFFSFLLASLLTCWNALAAAELTIELVPPMVAEGGNSVLFVHEMPLNVQAFYWYKQRGPTKSYEVARYLTPTNESSKMPQHSGRKTVFYSGSLLIRNVTQADSGVYTLLTFNTEMESELTHVHLEVRGKWLRDLWVLGLGVGLIPFYRIGPPGISYAHLLLRVSPRWSLSI